MIYLIIFILIVGFTDFCSYNSIHIFLFVDIFVKTMIVVTVISMIFFNSPKSLDLLIFFMAVFLQNYWRGKMFYSNIEKYLNNNDENNIL
jgi:hypothetical protein